MKVNQVNNVEKMYYLTSMQEGMLFHVLKDTGCNMYFGQGIFRIVGKMDATYFKQALKIVVSQNDALRTRIVYKKMKRPVQIVQKESRLDFVYCNFTQAQDQEKALNDAILEDRKAGMKLEGENLVRFRLYQLENEEYEFVFSFHHIILDGWCVGILAEEIFSAYSCLIEGREVCIEKRASYANYVHWLEKQDKSKSTRYWKKYLEGLETVTELPGNLSGEAGYKRGETRFYMPADIYKGVLKIAAQYGVTINHVADAIWGILLQKYNYTDDVVFGTVVSGRNVRVKDATKMIGLFINTLPLRVTAKKGVRFSDVLKELQTQYLESNEFSYTALQDIQKVTELGSQVISHLMAFQNFPINGVLTGDTKTNIQIKDWSVYQQTNYDLSIEVLQHDTLEYYVVYNANKYGDTYLKKVGEQLMYLYQQVIDNPNISIDRIQVINEKARNKILHEFNKDLNEQNMKQSIPFYFREIVRKYPDREVLQKGDVVLTYHELDQKTEKLMQLLLEKGCKKGTIVGIEAKDSPEMIIGMLSILKAGAAYLPIDSSFPINRKKQMLEETNARVLLRTSDMQDDLAAYSDVIFLDREDTWNSHIEQIPPELSGEDLAYVMFTSGTTNRPKGVMVRQKSVVRLVKNTNYITITEKDRILKTGAFAFDASTFEIWGALLCGAKLYLTEKEIILDSRKFQRELVENKITIIWLTAGLFNQLVDSNVLMFQNLKYLVTGGDIASAQHFNKFKENCPDVILENLYGPTENTTFSTFYPLTEINQGNVPIGKPISNSTAYIVDLYGNLLDVGMSGELCTGGYGVALGYLGDDELTRERYVRDPYIPGGKMYRTGDLAYWMEDGNIGFLGRLDKQLKIRGFRVSLSEIEDSIRNNFKEISDVSVIYDKSSKHLYAFITGNVELTEDVVKQALKKELPEYMIPTAVIILEKLPVTRNGKTDKRKLLAFIPEKSEREFECPVTPLEIRLCKIWEDSLGIGKVSVTDNFFEIGGDSILAMKMVANANKQEIAISISDLYDNPSVRELAKVIANVQDEQIIARNVPTYDADLEHEYDEFTLNEIQMAYLMGRNPQFELGGFSTHFYAEFDTNLDIKRLEWSLNRVIKRHPMMRAIIYKKGTQKIQKEVPEYKIMVEDLSNLSAQEQEVRLKQERERMEQYVFELETWPMFEFKAFKLEDEKYQLNFGIDVLVVDGASFFYIAKDLQHYYKEGDKCLDDFIFTFRDYTFALRDYRKQKGYEVQKQYWMNKLEDFPNAPTLPMLTDPTTLKNVKFKRKQGLLQEVTWQKIKQEAKNHNVTVAGLLCTVYSKILAHWSGQEELAINTTVFSRYPFHKDVQKMVGDFTCIMLLGIQIKDDIDFWEQVKEVQKVLGEALEHRDYSGVEFTREIGKYRGQKKRAIMPYVFTCALFEDSVSAWKSIGQMKYARSQTPQVYLDNQIIEADGELSIVWDYPDGIFEQELIDEMFHAYMDILESIAVGEIREIALSQKDLDLITAYNDTNQEIHEETLHGLFRKSAKLFSSLPAVSCGNDTYTYAQLDQYSEQLGACLVEQGVKSGTKVCVLGTRCLQTIVNILAVLKVGGTYIPVNPEYPKERQEYIFHNSDSQLFLYPDSFKLMNAEKYNNKCTEAENVNANAYVIYTSGSTGQPKGVVIGHKEAANTIQDMNQRFNITYKDKIIGLSSMGFDLSVYDIFGAFSAGAELVLVKDQRDVKEIHDIMKNKNISVWNSVPAIMEMYTNSLEKGYECLSLKHVWLSGDWIPVNLPRKIREHFRNVDITSLGGATEASIWSIYYPIEEVNSCWTSIPYGMPLANQQIYIFNNKQELCPCGVAGEIYIGGHGVAKEYLQDEEKTRYAFVEHDQYGRLYRTGDFGKMTREGYVEFLGRRDTQVKVRGYRIEAGEIESAMSEYPGVEAGVVDVYNAENGAKQLIGYLVLEKDNEIEQCKTPEYEKIESKIREASLSYHGGLTIENLKELNHSIEEISTAYIYQSCMKLGIKSLLTTGKKIEDICLTVDIIPEYHKLFENWLKVLVEEDVLMEEDGEYSWAGKAKAYDIEGMWNSLEDKEWAADLKTSFGYLKQSGENHINMLQGKVNALSLFFPKGSMATAESLYKFSPVASYLNQMVQAMVNGIVEGWKAKHPIRILEIGAGTGGTTDGILPLLKPDSVEYTFTDLSDFFLNAAKERYEMYPFMKYGILDINEDAQGQGYSYGAYDLILCANVIHDASSIQKTMCMINKLLDNNGILVLIEGTENSRQQMASVRFIEGLSQFQDERLESNQPLLSVVEWKKQFEMAKLKGYKAYPEDMELSNIFGNHLLIGQKCLRNDIPKEDEIKQYICKKLPDYMVPSKLIQIDEIPLTANGKINKKALVKPLVEQIRKGNFVPPVTECQKKLAKIWEEVLRIEQPGIHDSFFDLGGDSLKAVEIVSKAENQGIHISLTDMFTYLTIHELSNVIMEKEQSRDIKNIENLMLIREGSDPEKDIFFVHAGSGEVGVYVELCKYIDKKYNCWAFSALPRDMVGPENITMEELASRYITNMKKVKQTGPYELAGWCVGGTIAFEMVHQLEHSMNEVSNLILINSNAPSKQNKEMVVPFSTDSEKMLIKQLGVTISDNLEPDRIWDAIVSEMDQGKLSSTALKQMIPKTILRVIPEKDENDNRSLVKYVNRIRSYVNARDLYIPDESIKANVLFVGAEQERVENRGDWALYTRKDIAFNEVHGNHVSIFEGENVKLLAELINNQMTNEKL